MFRPNNRRARKAEERIPGKSSMVRGIAEPLEARLLLSTAIGRASGGAVAQPAAISLNTTSWTPIGPAPSSNPGSLTGAVSGRINAIATDPGNANIIYVAAAAGGVWKTTNGGTSWSPLTDSQSTLNSGAIAIAPSATSTIYVGTGDPTNSTNSFYGRGVLKSTDGGATWTLLGNSVFNRRTISSVVVDPTNANTVYVAVSEPGIDGSVNNTGIWKSTDGGTTWTNTTTAISSLDQYTDLKIDPSNPQHLLFAKESGQAPGGIYSSTNGGTTWTVVSGLPNTTYQTMTKLAFAPSNSQVIYASVASNFHLLSMWRSGDGGATWSQLTSTPDYLAGNAFYSDSLGVDPSNANIVYAGGLGGLLQSTDGGQHWTDITAGASSATHTDHHAEVFDASGKLLDGNDGGIWRLSNATVGSIAWTNLNTNLQIATFFSAALSPTDPNNAFAAGQDDGTAHFTGSVGWSQSDPSMDGGIIRFSPQNASRVYHLIPNYETTTGNFIRRSDDGGVTWTGITNGIDPTEPQSFLPGFAVDPANGNHLVFGTDRVYESYDGGNTWTAVSTPNANGWTSGTTSTVSNLAIAPSDPHTIYATDNGHVYVTSNDGATWTQRDPNNTPFAQIVVDPTNPLVAYAMQWQFGGSKITRTVDGGATWQNLSGNLPDLPVFSLVINQGTMYVGTDNGVYASTDDGTTWSAFGTGIPNVQVHELDFDPVHNILAAATYGRGMWEISTAQSSPLIVTTLNDVVNAGDGVTSLREAITTANSTGQSIGFDPSLAGGTINLNSANGALIVSRSITITGPAGAAVNIHASTTPLEISGSSTVRLTNFTLSGSATAFQVDAGSQAQLLNVSITSPVSDNGALNFFEFTTASVSAAITGTGSLTKNGPATLTLGGINSYSGGTTLRSGILYGNTKALAGNINLTAGATLAIDESTLAGSTGSFGGAVSGTGGVHVAVGAVQMGTFGASIASTLTNSGPTTIDPGATLTAAAANDLSATSTYTVNGNLNLGGFDQAIGLLSGGGNVYNLASPANTATLSVGTTSSSTFSGLLENVPSGSTNTSVLALKKVGTGQFTLAPTSVQNTFAGGTNITAGTLNGNTLGLIGSITGSSTVLNIDQSLGGLTSGILTGSLTGALSVSIASGTVRLAPSSAITATGASGVAVKGTLVAGATNQLGASSAYIVTGTLDLGGFSQSIGTLAGSGTIYNNTAQAGTATLSVGVSSGYFTGILEDHVPGSGDLGVLALSLAESSTTPFALTGANTYSGGTTLSSGLTIAGPSTGDPLGSGPIIFAGGNVSFRGQVTAVQQPVAVTGYNQDVIVEAGAATAISGTSASFDFPVSNGSFVWYEQGFGGAAAQGTGLPPGGLFVSQANPAVSFQLQPYTANNVVMPPGFGGGSVTVPLVSPASYSQLNFLAAAADGAANMTFQLNFADGSSTFVVDNLSDWFNGGPTAISAGGRIARIPNSQVSLTPGNPRMYEFDYSLSPSDQLKTLNSISVSQSSVGIGSNGIASRNGLFAISGTKLTFQPSENFGNAIQLNAPGTIDIQNTLSVAMGNLTIGNSSSPLSFTGPNSFLNNSPRPFISFGNVTLNGNATIDPGFVITASLGSISDGGVGYGISMDTNAAGSGVVQLAGVDTYGGPTQSSTGTISVMTAGGLPNNTTVNITQYGGVELQPGNYTVNLSSLNIGFLGRFDIGNNKVLIHYAPGSDPVATIRNYIANGYDGGKWDGFEQTNDTYGTIASSTATQDVNGKTAIGYGDSADGVVSGLPANTVEVAAALYGDTNLDGRVNDTDLARFNAHNGQPTGGTWANGDFNYDGAINSTDLSLLMRNYVKFGPQPPTLLKDVNNTTASSNPGQGTTLNGFVYFPADDGIHGTELWKTDGTAAGTQLISDITPGPAASIIQNLTTAGNLVFFIVRGSGFSPILYRTDGTPGGTVLLESPNGSLYNNGSTIDLTSALGKAFFASDNGAGGLGLWVSDGTPGGTQLISPAAVTAAQNITVVGSSVFFSNGSQLWISNGTPGGTTLVKDLGPPSMTTTLQLIGVGAKLFAMTTSTSASVPTPTGNPIWTSDGTVLGTMQVTTVPYPAQSPTAAGNILFFTDQASGGPGSSAMWESDGTAQGTKIVPGTNNSLPVHLGVAGNILYWENFAPGNQLWRSDGTTGGTFMLHGGYVSDLNMLQAVGSRMYFSTGDVSTGQPPQLWFTDGTVAGTQQMALGNAQGFGSIGVLGARFLYNEDDLVHGFEPWITDGTPAGTSLVTDINTLGAASSPTDFTVSGNSIYFVANDDAHGTQIWKSDGSNAGTTQVTNLDPPYGYNPQDLTDLNGHLFFLTTHYSFFFRQVSDIWKVDGSAAGASLLLDSQGFQISSATSLTSANGFLYFEGYSAALDGMSIFRSDGTSAGTVPICLMPNSGTPLFTAQGGNVLMDSSQQLYLVGSAGVTLLGPGGTYTPYSNAVDEIVFNGDLYYLSDTGTDMYLYRSDGTSLGTTILRHLVGETYAGNQISGPGAMVTLNNNIYFETADSSGIELWVSDTILGDTFIIANVSSLDYALSYTLAVYNGVLLFGGFDSLHGFELWESNGTAGNASMLSDINPGFSGSFPQYFYTTPYGVYFQAGNSADGYELWRTDGTTAGTSLIGDINPGAGSSSPANFAAFDGNLFFSADDGVHGVEPWVLSLPDKIVATPGNDSITLSRDSDGQHIDWTTNSYGGQIAIGDPTGLTIDGADGMDTITLDNTLGNPLPATLHLNGTFTINNLSLTNPLANTTLEIGTSTLYISYAPGQSPASLIRQYLQNGYNADAWNGAATVSTGAITSAAAASGVPNTYGIGYADSADGVVAGQPANTVEIRYTLMGDANLDGAVNLSDALQMIRSWNATGTPAWDAGNFNYDTAVNLGDATLLQKNWNGAASGAIASMLAALGAQTPTVATDASNSAETPSSVLTPVSTPTSKKHPKAHHKAAVEKTHR